MDSCIKYSPRVTDGVVEIVVAIEQQVRETRASSSLSSVRNECVVRHSHRTSRFAHPYVVREVLAFLVMYVFVFVVSVVNRLVVERCSRIRRG